MRKHLFSLVRTMTTRPSRPSPPSSILPNHHHHRHPIIPSLFPTTPSAAGHSFFTSSPSPQLRRFSTSSNKVSNEKRSMVRRRPNRDDFEIVIPDGADLDEASKVIRAFARKMKRRNLVKYLASELISGLILAGAAGVLSLYVLPSMIQFIDDHQEPHNETDTKTKTKTD